MSDPILRATASSYDRIVASYEDAVSSPPPERTGFRERFARRVPLGERCWTPAAVRARTRRGSRPPVCGRSAWTRPPGWPTGPASTARRRSSGTSGGCPFAAGSTDAVWSSASLLHIPRSDVPATLRGWHRVLRPGGVLGLIMLLGSLLENTKSRWHFQRLQAKEQAAA